MPSTTSKLQANKSGSHWAAITIKPELKLVTYKSSLLQMEAAQDAIKLIKGYLSDMGNHRKADRGKYQESSWSFIIAQNLPQQSDSYDCGVHVISYLMECLLNQELNWTSWQLKVLQSRLALQILEGSMAVQLLVQDPTLLDLSQTHGYYATMTPQKKRHQSQTPSVSPETTFKHQTDAVLNPPTRPLRLVKRLKMAPFPGSLDLRSGPAEPLDKEHFEEILKYKPMSSSSSSGADPENDPASMLPFCDWPVPEKFQEGFDFKLSSCLSSSITYERKNNTRAWRAKPGYALLIREFCNWHKTHSQIETWSSYNWPSVSKETLVTRVLALVPYLQDVCADPNSSYAFQTARQFWETHQRSYVIGARGMFEAARELGLSYYGGEGNTIMFQVVRNALHEEKLSLDMQNWVPIDDTNFALYNVLIPEVLIHLVMEDMGLEYDAALQVLEESKEFGLAGFTIETSD
ncbi:hypothetical protein RhiLY_01850 [Ceratobasidium sp. AG-Ba]|nr:hypothetical protein RhiLY_01850 [Ceratobasidium sp. AG-Ba]